MKLSIVFLLVIVVSVPSTVCAVLGDHCQTSDDTCADGLECSHAGYCICDDGTVQVTELNIKFDVPLLKIPAVDDGNCCGNDGTATCASCYSDDASCADGLECSDAGYRKCTDGKVQVGTGCFRPYCFSTDTGYKVTFRLRKDGGLDNRIDGLQAFDASINPRISLPPAATDAICRTTRTVSGFNNIYSLSFEFTTTSSTCGSLGSKVLIRATGINNYWMLDCAASGVIDDEITAGGVTVSGGGAYHEHLQNQWDIRFQAFEASGSNTPARWVDYGQDIKLRLIYSHEYENGLDNWGRLFHTGFIPHATANELILQIVTPGLGTNVHIQGTHTGNIIDIWVKVKRDHAVELRIPVEYMQTDATQLDWTIQARGIRIEASDDRIGVRAISNDGSGSSFIVLPDDILGTEYNGITLHDPADGDGEILIVATEDGTSVTVVYNLFSTRAGLDVNGVDADTGASTNNIMMDEFDVLHVRCNDECYQLKFDSDKPIAVIFGADNKGHINDPHPGHVSTQLIPVINYDNYFVLVVLTNGYLKNVAQNEDPNVAIVSYEDDWGTYDDLGTFPFTSAYNIEFRIVDFPVGYYLHQDADDYDPFLFPIPSVDQWGAYNYFYAKEGVTYSLVLVGRVGEVDTIAFKTGSVSTNLVGSTLGEQPDFGVAMSYILGLSWGPSTFERYDFDITVTDTRGGYVEQGLIELKSEKPWHTFMVIIQEEQDSYRNAYLPWGVRYPPTNPCVPTDFRRPGDFVNNDCDRFTDEEILNGKDDDDDGLIDEDVALDLNNRVTGIYVDDLYLCSDEACSSSTHIHTAGCYNDNSFGQDSDLKIEPFVHNTNLADEFDNYFVIDTPFFHAFRDDLPIGDDMLYFKVMYGLCFGDLSRCEQSCPDIEKKRSISGDENGVLLAIPVNTNGTQTTTQRQPTGNLERQQKAHPCSNNPVFWVPISLLFAILLNAVVATVFFTYKGYQFRRLLAARTSRSLKPNHSVIFQAQHYSNPILFNPKAF